MKNRFFDINENKYLNSIIIIAFLKLKKEQNIEELLISLYLFRYPVILGKIFGNIEAEKIFKKHELENINSESVEIDTKIYINGFYDSISFLYSMNLVEYFEDEEKIKGTESIKTINTDSFPKSLELKVKYIRKHIETLRIENIEELIHNKWRK